MFVVKAVHNVGGYLLLGVHFMDVYGVGYVYVCVSQPTAQRDTVYAVVTATAFPLAVCQLFKTAKIQKSTALKSAEKKHSGFDKLIAWVEMTINRTAPNSV